MTKPNVTGWFAVTLPLEVSPNITDTIGISDTFNATRLLPPVALTPDPLGIVDAVTLERESARVDPLGITDSLLLQRELARVDPLGITDSVSLARQSTLADLVGITDSVAAVFTAGGVIPDNSNVGAITPGATTTLGWNHTVGISGADVFVTITVSGNQTISAITCGGVAMTLVGSVALNNTPTSGWIFLYRLTGVSAGVKAIAITASGSTNMAGSSQSYVGVASIGSAQTAFGSGTSLSQSATCTAGQRILQTFGGKSVSFNLSSPTGGTNRVLNTSNNACADTISDATASTTFGATASATVPWGGIAVALSPV